MKLLDYIFYAPLPIALIGSWEASVRLGYVPNTLIASPTQTTTDLIQMLTSGTLLVQAHFSLLRLLTGFVLGSLAGVLLGTIVGTSKTGEKLLAPTLSFLAPIPAIAWVPLLIILFGIGESSKIALIGIASAVIVYTHTTQGIRSTDQKLVEVAHIYKKSKIDLVRKILLPSALPQIFIGTRIALGLSWVLLVAAEVIASSNGLGWLIWDARNFSRPDDMFVGMITIGALGKLTDQILVLMEHKTTRWRNVFQGT